MLDTNVFDSVAKGHVVWKTDRKVFATHVQRDELSRTSELATRERLVQAFKEMDATSLATETAVWDDSRWDEAKWSAADGVYERLLKRIMELDALSRKKRGLLNPSRDARIAETALKNELTLVTNDQNLAQAVAEEGGSVVSLADFLKL